MLVAHPREAYNFFIWIDTELSDRYKAVINGLIRSKNKVEKEHRRICRRMRLYKIEFWVHLTVAVGVLIR